jgi:KDO2-lipid IV(A) lauroyltransferase
MSKRYATLLHWIEFFAWKIVATVLLFLPRQALVMLADAAGWFAYRVLRIRRRIVEENLATAFGAEKSPRERDKIAVRSFQNMVLTFFEFLVPEPIFYRVHDLFGEPAGYRNYPELRDKAAIVVTGHIGNWETMASYAPVAKVKIAAIAKPMHNPLIDDAIRRSRDKRDLEIISTSGSMKKIVDAARRGMWITFLGDQDARRSGIFVKFFGKPASTAEGAALFAWKLNAPILPTYCVRLNDRKRRLQMHFYPPIYPDPHDSKDAQIRKLTEAHVESLEDIIRKFPDNYFWMHRRWKTKPKGERK